MRRRTHKPNELVRSSVLFRQNYCCAYCGRRFDSVVLYRRKPVILKCEWDHFIPFSYCNHSHGYNFVAACQICNRLKSSLVFDRLSEAKRFLKKRIRGIPSLRIRIDGSNVCIRKVFRKDRKRNPEGILRKRISYVLSLVKKRNGISVGAIIRRSRSGKKKVTHLAVSVLTQSGILLKSKVDGRICLFTNFDNLCRKAA